MPITRTAMIDDDGSGTTGTILNNAWKQELYNQIDGALVGGGSGITANVVTVTSVGTVHNLPCGPASVLTLIKLNNPTALTITGLAFATPPREGDVVYMKTGSAGIVSLAQDNAGSTIKFANVATSGPTPLAIGGSAIYTFHNGYFVLQQHEQGAWITPPYSAANFSAAPGAWTVEAGDVAAYKYHLSGRQISVTFTLNATSVSGGPTGLYVGGLGFSLDTVSIGGVVTVADNGVWGAAYCDAPAGVMRIVKHGQVPFTATTNNTYIFAGVSFPVA